ncbi:hypothetical protein AJ78_07610 [Emergomyces pasteurianus Ep9510]|uniref:Rhodopsin domain-containing protein n=1 Tax=Emergomyces pasteurianus Ep9510 TaxID=1447872 RepID=A0A1J9P706_9EURO|nr:hypothetical protein AJ78_07610 [Emergomyces pasteurianus Ep9510]
MAMTFDAKQNFILVGIFGFFTIIVMFARLLLQKIRTRTLCASDYLTIFALIFYCARTTLTVLVFLWGTNVINTPDQMGRQLTQSDVYHRELGSKLALANRVTYSTYLWIQKTVILIWYTRIPPALLWPNHILSVSLALLTVTFVLVQVIAFSECSPFHLYWQVEPNPGSCVKTVLHSFVHTIANSLTHLVLVAIPLPWAFQRHRSLTQKCLLTFLFSLGIFLIAIALAALPIPGRHVGHSYQNALQDSEALLIAFLANIFTITGLDCPSLDDDDIMNYHGTPFLTSSGKRRSNGSGFRSLFDRKILVTSNFELQSHTASPSRVRQMFPRHPWMASQRMSDENLITRAKGGRDSRD